MEQLHLLVLVVHFIWDGLVAYANTPAGQADLADIEAIVYAMENPGQTATTTTPGGTTGPTSSNPQIIRK